MTSWLRYVGVSAAVVAVLGAVLVALLGEAAMPAVLLAAGVGLAVQALAAFLLFGLRPAEGGVPHQFVVGWAGGALLRMMAVVVTALWVTRTEVVAEAPALLSMIGFLFVLTLIEPLFLKTTR